MDIKKLKEIIANCPDDFEVIDVTGRDFIHCLNIPEKRFVLSILKPIGHCNRCGEYVYKEEQLDYPAFCINCNENMYSFEYTEITKLFDKCIESLSDVKEFFAYLAEHDKTYHPDDSANTVGNTVDNVWVNTFTEAESVLYDKQMAKSIDICKSADVDIYDLMVNIDN